jgi:hypothetical protein
MTAIKVNRSPGYWLELAGIILRFLVGCELFFVVFSSLYNPQFEPGMSCSQEIPK